MEPAARTERLQKLRDQWQAEHLGVQFPSLGVELPDPVTPAEYVASQRLVVSDENTNNNHFGLADPKGILQALSGQFASAPQVDTKILKDAAVVLEVFKADSDKLAADYAPGSTTPDELLHATYLADAQATTVCQAILAALATELGISLPTKADRKRG